MKSVQKSKYVEYASKCWRYFKRIFIAIDQLLNAMCCGFEDETLSSRFHRWGEVDKWYMKLPSALVDFVLFFDTMELENGKKVSHCEKSFINERRRIGLPPELR